MAVINQKSYELLQFKNNPSRILSNSIDCIKKECLNIMNRKNKKEGFLFIMKNQDVSFSCNEGDAFFHMSNLQSSFHVNFDPNQELTTERKEELLSVFQNAKIIDFTVFHKDESNKFSYKSINVFDLCENKEQIQTSATTFVTWVDSLTNQKRNPLRSNKNQMFDHELYNNAKVLNSLQKSREIYLRTISKCGFSNKTNQSIKNNKLRRNGFFL